nr:hypothetical protein Iba_chr06bCG14350 [Ipomoea batatas]
MLDYFSPSPLLHFSTPQSALPVPNQRLAASCPPASTLSDTPVRRSLLDSLRPCPALATHSSQVTSTSQFLPLCSWFLFLHPPTPTPSLLSLSPSDSPTDALSLARSLVAPQPVTPQSEAEQLRLNCWKLYCRKKGNEEVDKGIGLLMFL